MSFLIPPAIRLAIAGTAVAGGSAPVAAGVTSTLTPIIGAGLAATIGQIIGQAIVPNNDGTFIKKEQIDTALINLATQIRAVFEPKKITFQTTQGHTPIVQVEIVPFAQVTQAQPQMFGSYTIDQARAMVATTAQPGSIVNVNDFITAWKAQNPNVDKPSLTDPGSQQPSPDISGSPSSSNTTADTPAPDTGLPDNTSGQNVQTLNPMTLEIKVKMPDGSLGAGVRGQFRYTLDKGLNSQRLGASSFITGTDGIAKIVRDNQIWLQTSSDYRIFVYKTDQNDEADVPISSNINDASYRLTVNLVPATPVIAPTLAGTVSLNGNIAIKANVDVHQTMNSMFKIQLIGQAPDIPFPIQNGVRDGKPMYGPYPLTESSGAPSYSTVAQYYFPNGSYSYYRTSTAGYIISNFPPALQKPLPTEGVYTSYSQSVPYRSYGVPIGGYASVGSMSKPLQIGGQYRWRIELDTTEYIYTIEVPVVATGTGRIEQIIIPQTGDLQLKNTPPSSDVDEEQIPPIVVPPSQGTGQEPTNPQTPPGTVVVPMPEPPTNEPAPTIPTPQPIPEPSIPTGGPIPQPVPPINTPQQPSTGWPEPPPAPPTPGQTGGGNDDDDRPPVVPGGAGTIGGLLGNMWWLLLLLLADRDEKKKMVVNRYV